jgi:hypothetical protein
MMKWLLLTGLLFAACDPDETPPHGISDLSAISDLGASALDGSADMADMSSTTPTNFDLAWSTCAGTKLAGTCAGRFFDSFAACFTPAGHCGWIASAHSGLQSACWQNGASYFLPPIYSTTVSRTYTMGKDTCLKVYDYDDSYRGIPTVEQFCALNDTSCGPQAADGGTDTPVGGALYNTRTGIFTCPDGTKVDVGPDLGGCSALNRRLSPIPTCDNLDPLNDLYCN